MYTKPNRTTQQSLFFDLESQLNQKHPLYLLANKIDWNVFEESFKGLYCANNGRPAKPIRRMVGLLILKHVRNVSDESIVEQWQENIYYQYFCGEQAIQTSVPCTPTELVEFRKRIGEDGIELILKESIRVNDDHDDIDRSFIDSTVQEKNITFPTDAKLTKKVIARCLKISAKLGLPMRQSYKREMKSLARDQRFRNHPKNKTKAFKADRRMKTIAGRLVREQGVFCSHMERTDYRSPVFPQRVRRAHDRRVARPDGEACGEAAEAAGRRPRIQGAETVRGDGGDDTRCAEGRRHILHETQETQLLLQAGGD